MGRRGAMGSRLMDEHHEPLQHRPPLVPTGVPHGLDAALRSLGAGRQTGQGPQRGGYADQTPMASALRMRYALQPTCP